MKSGSSQIQGYNYCTIPKKVSDDVGEGVQIFGLAMPIPTKPLPLHGPSLTNPRPVPIQISLPLDPHPPNFLCIMGKHQHIMYYAGIPQNRLKSGLDTTIPG